MSGWNVIAERYECIAYNEKVKILMGHDTEWNYLAYIVLKINTGERGQKANAAQKGREATSV